MRNLSRIRVLYKPDSAELPVHDTTGPEATTDFHPKDSLSRLNDLRKDILKQDIQDAKMEKLFNEIGKGGKLKIVEEDQSSGGTNVIVRTLDNQGKLRATKKRLYHDQEVTLADNPEYKIGKGENGVKHVYIKVVVGGEEGYIASEHLQMEVPPVPGVGTGPGIGGVPVEVEKTPVAEPAAQSVPAAAEPAPAAPESSPAAEPAPAAPESSPAAEPEPELEPEPVVEAVEGVDMSTQTALKRLGVTVTRESNGNLFLQSKDPVQVIILGATQNEITKNTPLLLKNVKEITANRDGNFTIDYGNNTTTTIQIKKIAPPAESTGMVNDPLLSGSIRYVTMPTPLNYREITSEQPTEPATQPVVKTTAEGAAPAAAAATPPATPESAPAEAAATPAAEAEAPKVAATTTTAAAAAQPESAPAAAPAAAAATTTAAAAAATTTAAPAEAAATPAQPESAPAEAPAKKSDTSTDPLDKRTYKTISDKIQQELVNDLNNQYLLKFQELNKRHFEANFLTLTFAPNYSEYTDDLIKNLPSDLQNEARYQKAYYLSRKPFVISDEQLLQNHINALELLTQIKDPSERVKRLQKAVEARKEELEKKNEIME